MAFQARHINAQFFRQSGSVQQNQNMPSTPKCRNVSTCGFFARKERCARGFRYLPHTSGRHFRKCGVKLRSGEQAPVSPFRDLRFCWQKSGCAQRFSIFPRTSGIRGLAKRVLATSATSATTSVVAETSKGRCRKTGQRPFFISASRRVHGDCITRNILP